MVLRYPARRGVNRPAIGHAHRVRVATFNILNGRSPEDDRVDIGRYVDAVRGLDADVLALQEVDRNQHRSDRADLTALAADAMGAPYHRFVAAVSGTPGATWIAATGTEQPDDAAYGIALLSRHPVTGWSIVRLPPVPVRVPMRFGKEIKPVWVRDEPRVAVIATIDTPSGTLTVVNTHLSFIRWWNGRQLRRLVGSVAGRTAVPALLVGDLNMGPERAGRLTGMRHLASHLTFPVDEPREQIDHVLAAGDVEAKSSEAVRLPLSDHRALVVDLAG
jgi:endonuclease/exonuclease/phosphatase family metal-dependent hydrolase